MEDLFAAMAKPQPVAAEAPDGLKEYSVTEISVEIKRCVETRFNRIKVKGEIFGCKRADSGHYYLSLKDENAVISAVCWRGVASGLKFKPEDGLEVVAVGKITTFAGKSSYQLVIDQLEISGKFLICHRQSVWLLLPAVRLFAILFIVCGIAFLHIFCCGRRRCKEKELQKKWRLPLKDLMLFLKAEKLRVRM